MAGFIKLLIALFLKLHILASGEKLNLTNNEVIGVGSFSKEKVTASKVTVLIEDYKEHYNSFHAFLRNQKDFFLGREVSLIIYNSSGNPFQRLSNIFNKHDLYPQQIITVEVALGSELILASESRGEVYFEVTNHADTAQIVYFTCSDSKYILQSLSTYRKYLEPLESTLVILYVHTYKGIYQDEITFSARTGTLRIQKKVLVDVGTQIGQYRNKLYAEWKYTSDCTGILYSQCSSASWRIEVTFHAPGSGLVQLSTEPKGIYIPLGYIAGTTEPVTGYYSESCCNPELEIFTMDRARNRVSYYVNAFHNTLSGALIAAIILGIILLIILITVMIYIAVKRWKRKGESYELPIYRGGILSRPNF